MKGYPFEVVLPAGLPINGAVLSDQVRSLDWRARKASRICELPVGTIEEIVGKLEALVSLR
jgi:mRNA interferase MazF